MVKSLSGLFGGMTGKERLATLLIVALKTFVISPFIGGAPIIIVLVPVILTFYESRGVTTSGLLVPLSCTAVLKNAYSIIKASAGMIILNRIRGLNCSNVRVFAMAPVNLVCTTTNLLCL